MSGSMVLVCLRSAWEYIDQKNRRSWTNLQSKMCNIRGEFFFKFCTLERSNSSWRSKRRFYFLFFCMCNRKFWTSICAFWKWSTWFCDVENNGESIFSFWWTVKFWKTPAGVTTYKSSHVETIFIITCLKMYFFLLSFFRYAENFAKFEKMSR